MRKLIVATVAMALATTACFTPPIDTDPALVAYSDEFAAATREVLRHEARLRIATTPEEAAAAGVDYASAWRVRGEIEARYKARAADLERAAAQRREAAVEVIQAAGKAYRDAAPPPRRTLTCTTLMSGSGRFATTTCH